MNSFFKELRSTVTKQLLPTGYEGFEINPSEHITPDNALWTFDNIGGSYNYFRYTGFGSCVEAYNRCPIVSAIINQQAQAFVNGRTKFFDEDGNEIKKGNKTVEKIRSLLRKPNPLQSQIAFEAQIMVYLKLFGFALVLPVKPAGFTKKEDASSLWCIPPNWLDWSATNERFDKFGGTGLKEIVVTYNGVSTIFKLDELIFIKDFTPQLISDGNALTFPQSKVFSNEMFINNIIGALESRNMLINYRGALGILSQDSGSSQFAPMAMTPEQKDDLQKDFKRYGLRRNQFQVILTSASLKWQQMGYPTKELMLMEEVEQSSVGLCASWNFPAFILGFKDATFHNMGEAEAHLYQNCTIPDAENIYGTLGDAFELIDKGIFLRKDYSHVAPLQEDKLDAAAARFALNRALEREWVNGKLTLNQWCDRLGEEPIQSSDGRGDLYYPEYVIKYGDPSKAISNNNNQQNSNNNDTGKELDLIGKKYDEKKSLFSNIFSKYDPSEPRDERGRWTDGGGNQILPNADGGVTVGNVAFSAEDMRSIEYAKEKFENGKFGLSEYRQISLQNERIANSVDWINTFGRGSTYNADKVWPDDYTKSVFHAMSSNHGAIYRADARFALNGDHKIGQVVDFNNRPYHASSNKSTVNATAGANLYTLNIHGKSLKISDTGSGQVDEYLFSGKYKIDDIDKNSKTIRLSQQ